MILEVLYLVVTTTDQKVTKRTTGETIIVHFVINIRQGDGISKADICATIPFGIAVVFNVINLDLRRLQTAWE